jgi:hypothetical protein
MMGPILDTITISRDIVGAFYKELGVACKHVFIVRFYCTCKGPPFCLLVCNTAGL